VTYVRSSPAWARHARALQAADATLRSGKRCRRESRDLFYMNGIEFTDWILVKWSRFADQKDICNLSLLRLPRTGLDPEPPGDFDKPAGIQIYPHVHPATLSCLRDLLARKRLLIRPLHIHRLEPVPLGGFQVAQVRGDERAVLGLQAEPRCGAVVHQRRGFVGAKLLRAGDVRERQGAMPSEVLQQGEVAVGEGARLELVVQPGEAFDGVGPRVQTVPAEGQLAGLIVCEQALDVPPLEQLLEGFVVVLVYGDEALLGGIEVAREVVVGPAPFVGEGAPVLRGQGGHGLPQPRREVLVRVVQRAVSVFSQGPDDRRAPVDGGAEDVEEDNLGRLLHGHCLAFSRAG